MRATTPTILVTAGLVFAACTACRGASAAARDDHPIARLLEAGFGAQRSSLLDAQRHYESARTGAANDGRVDYAMALVMLRHRKYDEARTLLEAAVAKDRTNLAAWRALAWLNVLTGKSESSLKQMHALARLYPKAKARAEMEQPLRDSARWMGQLVGFLEGPGKKAVAAETVGAHAKAIAGELTGPWRQSFDAGRRQVLDQHARAQDELATAQKTALAEEKQQKAADLKSIDEERARIAGELSQLRGEADAAKSQSDQDIRDVDKYLAPLVEQNRNLQALAAPHVSRIAELQRHLARAEAAARGDKEDRDRAAREAERLRRDLRREEDYFRPIQGELIRVQAEGNRLTAQRAAALARYQNTLRALNLQQQKLNRTGDRLDKKERLAKQPATGRSGKTNDLSNRSVALTTYCAFPLDEARRRLLESLEE